MIRKYIIEADDSIKGFDGEIAKLEREWGAEEIESSEDCIRREKTLNKINELIAEYIPLMPTGWTLPLNIAKTINELPSVTPQLTSWIPVSERLPEAYEFVNCTCHSLIDDREDWVIETVYIPQPSYSPYSDWGNIPMLNSGDCKVVAWMHRDIPEPYKAESEKV